MVLQALSAVTFRSPHASIKIPGALQGGVRSRRPEMRRIACFAGPGAPEAPVRAPMRLRGRACPGSGGSVLEETDARISGLR